MTIEQTATFKQGSRVRLAGSDLIKGIVIYAMPPGKFANIKVRWDNGHTGMCKAEDLEHVPTSVRS